tara:strand:+ start:2464 stop:2859 length:396 start_codon:yes stop_codon:yes gene_type:complete
MQNLYLKMNNKITMQLYDVPPAEIRGNSRSHFKVTRQINRKRRETAKFLALDAMHETGIKTLKPRVVVHYHFYNTREIDLDNLIIGMKSTLDGIVDSGLIEDDNPSKLKLEAEFTLCKKEEKKTLITVAEI